MRFSLLKKGFPKRNLYTIQTHRRNSTAALANKSYRPSSLALAHIDSGKPTTSEVINSVLSNQKVSISQKELDGLLRLPSVIFNLPITDQTYPSLLALIGKPQSRRSNCGVYIFTHKNTGNKYAGSSNDLARRFKQYFEKNVLFNNKTTGMLLPLLEKEGFDAFTLEIIIIPESFSNYPYCFLEQYYLLDKRFNLNTQRIVNFRVNQGFKIFLYDLDCKILYFTSQSLNAFCADLGIHNSTYKKGIKGVPYLDFFTISNAFVVDAIPANLTLSELRDLLAQRREESFVKRVESYGKIIEVIDKETNARTTYPSVQSVASKFNIDRATIRRG